MLLVPGDPTINEHLGDALWRAGRHIDARFQWSHALTFADDDTDKAAIERKLKIGPERKAGLSVVSCDQRSCARQDQSVPACRRRAAPTAFIPCRAWRCSPTWAMRWRWRSRRTCRLRIEGLCHGLGGRGRQSGAARRACLGRRQGARLTLTKNLPVASGIGGGSADAAAALRGLSRLWSCRSDEARCSDDRRQSGLRHSGLCGSVAAFMEGRGEILRPAASMPQRAHAAGQSRRAGADQGCVCGASEPQRRGDEAAAAAVSRTPPICCAFWKPPATIWKRRRAGLAAGDRRSAGGDRGVAGRAAGAHVGQRRHLFWHLCR